MRCRAESIARSVRTQRSTQKRLQQNSPSACPQLHDISANEAEATPTCEPAKGQASPRPSPSELALSGQGATVFAAAPSLPPAVELDEPASAHSAPGPEQRSAEEVVAQVAALLAAPGAAGVRGARYEEAEEAAVLAA